MFGYLSYNYVGPDVSNQISDIGNYSESFGDVELVSSQNTYPENEVSAENINNIDNNETAENIKNTEEDILNNYFEESRLERDKMYSETLEVYENILANDSITNEQKAIAENEITEITNIKSGILIAENLIKVKGFEDVVIFINDAKATVIVKSNKLKKEEIAQIQNIIVNQLGIEINNISISNREN